MALHDLSDVVKTESVALHIVAITGGNTIELIEDPSDRGRRDATAAIAHRDGVKSPLTPGPEGDFRLARGILDGVVYQIADGLAQQLGIGLKGQVGRRDLRQEVHGTAGTEAVQPGQPFK